MEDLKEEPSTPWTTQPFSGRHSCPGSSRAGIREDAGKDAAGQVGKRGLFSPCMIGASQSVEDSEGSRD